MSLRVRRLAALLPLLACNPNLGLGAQCDATGDGFTRRDPCAFTCVEWEVPCADGSVGVPGVCSELDCALDPAVCPTGSGCARINMTDWECLPLEVCPSGFAGSGR